MFWQRYTFIALYPDIPCESVINHDCLLLFKFLLSFCLRLCLLLAHALVYSFALGHSPPPDSLFWLVKVIYSKKIKLN